MKQSAVVLCTLVLFGCGIGQKPVSFRDQIQPIFQAHCVQCHGDESPRGRISLTSYASLTSSHTVSGKAPLTVAGQPDQSRLYILCATDQKQFRMPPDTSSVAPLTPAEIELVGKWIMQGAKDN